MANNGTAYATGISTEDRAARVARTTMVLLFLAWLVDYIDRLVITLALPSIGKEFHLDKAAQGLILTVFFITYALFQLPGGLLADKVGVRRTMTWAMSAWSVFTALTGLAYDYTVLLVVRAVFGVAEGIFPAASMKAITERTRPQQRMFANGVMLCSNSLGSAVAPLIAAPALAAVGWRNSFFIVAVLGIVMAVVLWRMLPPALPREDTETGSVRHASEGAHIRLRDVLTSRGMWMVTLTFCGFDVIGWGLVSWTPSYLVEARHLNIAAAGMLTSIPFFVGTVATVAGGRAFDRFFHNQPRRLIVPAMALTAVFLWFMIHAPTVERFVLFESLAAAALYSCFMPIFGLPLRLLPQGVVGAGGGLVNFGGQLAGAITPFVMGALVDRFSFTAGFAFLFLGAGLAIVSSILTPQTQEAFARSFRSHAVAA
jgi:sugar phosphate permease